MSRIQWRTFDRGLWLAGGRDNPPDGALRRATGVSQLREGAIRAARGARVINLFGANQYIEFADALFQSSGDDVLRDGVVINAGFPQSGLLGIGGDGRASFLRAPPQPELTDYLFVAGGNNPFKVKADGTSASKWGIDAPPDGFQAGSDFPTGNTKPIDACDSAATWTSVDGDAPTDETTIAIGGLTSMRFDNFGSAGTRRYTKGVVTNLEHFGTGLSGAISADQDYIELWIRIVARVTPAEKPAPEFFDSLEIAFSLGNDDFSDNVYTRQVQGVEGTVPTAGLADQTLGVAAVVINDVPVTETDVVNSTGIFGAGADTRTLLNALGQTSVFRQADVWQRLRLPKLTFDRTGGNAALTWADVQAIRLTFRVSGAVGILVDQISLAGGYGLIGNYQYRITYKNSITGSRSNPNPTAVLFKGVDRGRIVLGNFPVSTDPQVDKIEIWRTVGNGEAFFLVAEINHNPTPVYTDEVVDTRALFTGFGYLTASQLPDVIESDELPLDNDPPPVTIREVLPTLHVGRAWWLDGADGERGRLFYSPQGRPEAVDGFVEVTNTDDDLQTPIRWNDVIYVFSRNTIFRIVGDDEPFVAQEVFGAPGTTQPDTVVATPFGICYFAADGPRIFDGSFSQPVNADALGPIFRGYDVEDVEAFVGISAAYIRDDYFITAGDGQTLVYNLRTQAWRLLQIVCVTLYASEDGAVLVASIGTAFVTGVTAELEAAAADTATTFELEVPARRIAVDTQGIVQRLFVDIETGGLAVTPTLVLDTGEFVLPVIDVTARTQVEYAMLKLGRFVALRLEASVMTETVIVYGIEADVYVPVGSEAAA